MTESQRPLRIAILGTRGVPARYGGFETFAEELSKRLHERGHDIIVYERHKFGGAPATRERKYNGVRVRSSTTVHTKYLETVIASLTSFLDVIFQRVDVIILCNAANSPFAWIARLCGIPVAINVDGIERKRSKWNWAGKAWYRLGEICSCLFASRVIADAEVIADYYRSTYRVGPDVIAYGAHAERLPAGPVLEQFHLTPKGYILYVSRFEPENNALGVVQAYVASGVSTPLVMVGSAPYATDYIAQVHAAAAGHSIIFTGFQFGAAYQELQSNCLLYIQATEVGGTHPALIEAMAYGNCVVANGTPENIEVLGDAGRIYPKNDFESLAQILRELTADSQSRTELGHRAATRAAARYSWGAITDAYEGLCRELVA